MGPKRQLLLDYCGERRRVGHHLVDVLAARFFLCSQDTVTRALTSDDALTGTGGAVQHGTINGSHDARATVVPLSVDLEQLATPRLVTGGVDGPPSYCLCETTLFPAHQMPWRKLFKEKNGEWRCDAVLARHLTSIYYIIKTIENERLRLIVLKLRKNNGGDLQHICFF